MSEDFDFQLIDKFFTNIDFVVPGYERSSQYMVAIHRAFYEWAAEKVKGKIVLEAGCGEGFGADILSYSAEYVVAIDIKPELIQHARQRYPGSNIDFQVMDCESMSFDSETFDVVVCNELIEHLEDYEAFMQHAHRVLVRGGSFICATTNSAITFREQGGAPMNRNHFREFDARQFRSELLKSYQSVRLYSQVMNEEFRRFTFNKAARLIERLLVGAGIKHKIPIRLRNFVRQLITGVDLSDATQGGFQIVEGTYNQALYLIGEAVKADPLRSKSKT